jgi:RNA polymerase sigma-70 factor (ECF subfamily)
LARRSSLFSLPGIEPIEVAVKKLLPLERVESRAAKFSEPSAEDRRGARQVDAEDSSLISRIRRDPPDPAALDELVGRYWKRLFGRCHLLTLNPDKANDLAQDAWCRVLRARHSLKPEGNFPAYLVTVATNLWRDSQRHARRAGPLAEHRIASLDAPLPEAEGETFVLADALPDWAASQSEEAARLRLDIDEALGRLSPMLRDVLVARFIAGESCAEIGRRYGRTEQTVSGWVRAAVREMKLHMEDPSRVGVVTGTT